MRLPSLFRHSPPAIRGVRQSEAGEVSAMHADAFHKSWSVHEVEQLLTDPAVLADAAQDSRAGGALLGFVLSRKAADQAEILSIAVTRRARGRGVARKLLANHATRLAQAGIRHLFLEVEEGNAPARALYARAGFVEVGRREAYYRKPDGSTATALVLRLDL
jgi:[ribosomal protein S18]-alanine N-acetyltransferase